MDQQPVAHASTTTSLAYPRRADLMIRAGAMHSMTQERTIYRAIAIRGERIVALSADPHGLDALLADGAHLLDDPGLTLLPALYDTHNHLLEAARNFSMVAVDQARSIADLVELIRQRAAQTPAGQWIRTTNAWNESTLAERRLPTAAELDAATTQHPVLVRRGGHNGVANSEALRLAGISAQSPNPPGGSYGRLADGTPNGILEGGAVYVVAARIPPSSFEEQVAGLSQASSVFAAQGIGAVRDPLIQRDELLVYQAAWERGQLSARCRPMVVVTPPAGSASVADRVALIEGLGVRSGFGDDRLRIWGLKFVMDGGVEGAALEEPFTAGPAGSGHLNWNPDDMVAVANVAVRRGWRR